MLFVEYLSTKLLAVDREDASVMIEVKPFAASTRLVVAAALGAWSYALTDEIAKPVPLASDPSAAASLMVFAIAYSFTGGGGGALRVHNDVLLHWLSELQSESPLQVRPRPHLALQVPPPSRQVSKPFRTPSAQVGV